MLQHIEKGALILYPCLVGAQEGNYIFTTEGHPIPVDHPLMRQPPPPFSPVSAVSAAAAHAHAPPQTSRVRAAETAVQCRSSRDAKQQLAHRQPRAASAAFGTLRSNRSALQQMMCPDFSMVHAPAVLPRLSSYRCCQWVARHDQLHGQIWTCAEGHMAVAASCLERCPSTT